MNAPEELLYSDSHEWVRIEGEEAVFGITDFAQNSLGDITYCETPAEGETVEQGAACGSVESVKAASDILSPVSGTVKAVNGGLEDAPEVMNSDPYGEGWICRVAISAKPEGLMDADAYVEFCKKEAH